MGVRGKRVRVTRDQLEKLHLRDKLSVRDMALVLGVSEMTIRYRMHDYGIRVRRWGPEKRGRPASVYDEEEAARLYVGGESTTALAARYGAARGTIRARLEQRGVKLRSRREAQALRKGREPKASVPSPMGLEDAARIRKAEREEELTRIENALRECVSDVIRADLLERKAQLEAAHRASARGEF